MSMGSGGMFGDPGQLPINMDPRLTQAPEMKTHKGGMFGSGVGIGEAIVHALNGYLAGQGNPVGAMNMQAIHGNRLQKQRQELEEQQYQRQRSDGIADFETRQQIEAKYAPPPQPTQTDRYLAELMDPSVPAERKKMLSQVLFPPVMGVVNGVPSMIDRASMFGGAGGNLDAEPASEDGFDYTPGPGGRGNKANWKPSGGPSPQGSGGFLGL